MEDGAEHVQARIVADVPKRLKEEIDSLLRMKGTDVPEADGASALFPADRREVAHSGPQQDHLLPSKPAAHVATKQELARRQKEVDIMTDTPSVCEEKVTLVVEARAPRVSEPSRRPIRGGEKEGTQHRVRILARVELPSSE